MGKNKKIIGIISIVIIFTIITGVYIIGGKNDLAKNNNLEEIFKDEDKVEAENTKETNTKGQSTSETKQKGKITIDIKGEVKKPGVYTMEEGSIVEDVIKKAGGITNEANLDSINRAQLVKANEAIVIPNKNSEQIANPAFNNTAPKQNSSDGKSELININTASLEELKKINGVGDATAQRIIEYREEKGGFKSIEDIKNVERIGEKTFQKIKEYICI